MRPESAIAIGPLLREDILQLADLAKSVWLETFSVGLTDADVAEAIASRDQKYFEIACFGESTARQTILVAKSQAELAGFIEFGLAETPTMIIIDKLYVASAYQAKGLGKRLMQQSLDHPDFSGKQVQLDVWVENTRAFALYKSMGFEVVGERAFHSSSGEELTPDLIMRREPLA